MPRRLIGAGLGVICCALAGCAARPQTPLVIFLDGAGHFGYAGRVKQGLRQAGYDGRFESFVWTALPGLGVVVDHLVVARAGGRADALARKIEQLRKTGDDGPIHLIGLSAGTAILMAALERLDQEVMVDNVVLLSSSISARRNLTDALGHLRGHLYVTASRGDQILVVMAVNADGGSGPPAGRRGMLVPRDLPHARRDAYRKVVNLPWKPSYAGFGWNGGHTSVTAPKFIESVIAPRLASNDRFPIDRPLY